MTTAVELRLAALEARVAALESGGGGGSTAKSSGSGGGLVADDHELDSQYGDPVVKKDPPRWSGDSFAGCKMSECPSDYLSTLADFYDWQGDKDDQSGKTWTSTKPGSRTRPASDFKRKDAARARGWANRNRDARPAETSDADPFEQRRGDASEDDQIPF